VVPAVYPRWCTQRLLVLDYIEGRHLADIELQADEATRAARLLVRLVLKNILDDGFFHSDPHPGNILLLADGRLALLDFGQMGWITRERAHLLCDLLVALEAGDAERVTRLLLHLGEPDDGVPVDQVITQVQALMLRYYAPGTGRVELARLIERLLATAWEHRVRVPPVFTLVVKCMVTLEEVVGTLDPHLSLSQEARPFVRKLVMERMAPSHLGRSLSRYASELSEAATSLPYHASEVARKLARGKLTTELRHLGLERLVDALEHGSNRVSFALVIAALIVGSSIVVRSGLGPNLWGISALGLVGFSLAALMGLWLLVGIVRSGRL
jgi:ubiquinone biosynthesis protein